MHLEGQRKNMRKKKLQNQYESRANSELDDLRKRTKVGQVQFSKRKLSKQQVKEQVDKFAFYNDMYTFRSLSRKKERLVEEEMEDKCLFRPLINRGVMKVKPIKVNYKKKHFSPPKRAPSPMKVFMTQEYRKLLDAQKRINRYYKLLKTN